MKQIGESSMDLATAKKLLKVNGWKQVGKMNALGLKFVRDISGPTIEADYNRHSGAVTFRVVVRHIEDLRIMLPMLSDGEAELLFDLRRQKAERPLGTGKCGR